MYIICNSFAGLLIFVVVVFVNTNFRLNSGSLNELKEQGHCDPGDASHR